MDHIDFPRPGEINGHQYYSKCIVHGLGGMQKFDSGSDKEYRSFLVELPGGTMKEVCAWTVKFTDR